MNKIQKLILINLAILMIANWNFLYGNENIGLIGYLIVVIFCGYLIWDNEIRK